MSIFIIILVVLGFVSIVVEDIVHIDKAKTTLFLGTAVWILHFATPSEGARVQELTQALNENLVDIATLWLFLVAAMTFVAYLSSRGVIRVLVGRIMPARISEKKLMFVVALFAFSLSSLADNITSTLVCMTVLLSLKLQADKLIRYAVVVIYAVNSGGVTLITGDVTTLMIFLSGKVSIVNLLILFLPAFVSVMALAAFLSIPLRGELIFAKDDSRIGRGDKLITLLFMLTVLGCLVANILFGVPPVLSFLFGLASMFLVVQFMNRDEEILDYVRRVEFDTLLFFLGVLLLVGMLKEQGVLDVFPQLYEMMPPLAANFLMGLLSAAVDNVPMTAALLKSGISMSTAQWLGFTYAVGVGGSLLVIGSGAGVIAMSKLQELTFVRYLKFIIYLLGAYTLGYAGVYLLATCLL